jgi:uncharacterized membrane protein
MAYPAIRKMNASSDETNGSGLEQNVGQVERIVSAALGSWMLISAFGSDRNVVGRTSRLGIGGYLLYRGLTGNCPAYSALGMRGQQAKAIELRTSLTVNKPKEEVYRYWRKLENLPRFMDHLKSVRETDNRRSHWEAKIPGNIGTIEWDAEITDERQGELIAWQSVEDATVFNSGHVSFREAPGGRGTEIMVRIIYQPPAGNAGSAAAKLLNPVFEKMVRADIMRFKQVIESGEVSSNQGQVVKR